MMFKKNGRLYGNIELLLNECCQTTQYCFQCALHGKVGTKSVAPFAGAWIEIPDHRTAAGKPHRRRCIFWVLLLAWHCLPMR